MSCRSALQLAAMLVLAAVFAGASYAATKPQPALDPPPMRSTSTERVLECPPGPVIRQARFLPVYNKEHMITVKI